MPFEIYKKPSEINESIQQSIDESMNSTAEFNHSLADRIDLHMCNRETSIIEQNKSSESEAASIFKKPNVHHKSKDENQRLFSTQAKKNLFQTRIGTQSRGNEEDINNSLADRSNLSLSETTINFPSDTEDRFSSTRLEFTSNESKNLQPFNEETIIDDDDESDELSQHASQRKVQTLKFNIEQFKSRQKKQSKKLHKLAQNNEEKEIEIMKNIKFKTKNIESKDAENELDRCMTKEDFKRMKICGQFNKGKV